MISKCDICKKSNPYIEKENYLNRTCNNCFFEKFKVNKKYQKNWKNITIIEKNPLSWGDMEVKLSWYKKNKKINKFRIERFT